MKILRLSLFNLKKNKREAIGIAILTFFTTLMLAIAAANHAKVDKVFNECFAESGSKDYAILFRGDKYRNAFKDVLHDDYGVGTVAEGRMLSAQMIIFHNLKVHRKPNGMFQFRYFFIRQFISF